MNATTYQGELRRVLSVQIGEVHSEWSVRRDAVDSILGDAESGAIYAPHLDIAVGPYNVTRDRDEGAAKIRKAAEHPLIDRIIRSIDPNNLTPQGHNPRCLVAIEN